MPVDSELPVVGEHRAGFELGSYAELEGDDEPGAGVFVTSATINIARDALPDSKRRVLCVHEGDTPGAATVKPEHCVEPRVFERRGTIGEGGGAASICVGDDAAVAGAGYFGYAIERKGTRMCGAARDQADLDLRQRF